MNDTTLHERLQRESDFTRKLQKAITEGELVYWSKRLHPPNLEEHDFRTFASKLRPPLQPDWVGRKSLSGKYGMTGENECFQFEKRVAFLGNIKNYYVKGFFFEKENLKGVEVQSFREVKKPRFL